MSIYLLNSNDSNSISGNTCNSNLYCGIFLSSSSNNTISGNTCNDNSVGGIGLIMSSENNTLSGNTCNSNLYCGIFLSSSSNNTIYLNNFTNNTVNVYSEDSTNLWNSPEQMTYTYNGNTYTSYLGNYWSDYSGSDADGDGIWDSPYSINSDKDNYPLVVPFENYIEVTTYTLTINVSGGGTTDPIPGIYSYDAGTVVSLTASPDPGWEFSYWSGDASGTSPSTTVIMDGDKKVTAYFTLHGITLIGAIKQNPAAYEGQEVTVSGEYRGWESGHGSPPVTRSDWVIRDDTGSIYVTGRSSRLRYPEDIGKAIKVSGVVKLKDGQPYIEVKLAGS